MRSQLVVIALAALVSASASAEGRHVSLNLAPGVNVDWTRGAALSVAAAPGDPRAPSAAIARTKARRQARESARTRLSTALLELPMAGGGRLADSAPEVLERVRQAAADAVVVDEILGSDGSSVVTVAVGVEEIRSAVVGASRPGDAGLEAVIVDAKSVALQPAAGLAIRVAGSRHVGPALFFASAADARSDPRVGPGAPMATATAVDGRDVDVSGLSVEQVDDAQRCAAVVAFVVKVGGRK